MRPTVAAAAANGLVSGVLVRNQPSAHGVISLVRFSPYQAVTPFDIIIDTRLLRFYLPLLFLLDLPIENGFQPGNTRWWWRPSIQAELFATSCTAAIFIRFLKHILLVAIVCLRSLGAAEWSHKDEIFNIRRDLAPLMQKNKSFVCHCKLSNCVCSSSEPIFWRAPFSF